ncbi:MAG: hypothetical protein RR603_07260 [Kurthia sp.]
MMKFKTIYRLNVSNGLFYIGQWNREPSQEEIIHVMQERFKENAEFLNNERLTFQVEKIHFLVSDEVKIGDFVQVGKPFVLEDEIYEYNEKFSMQHLQMAAGIEMYVKKGGVK